MFDIEPDIVYEYATPIPTSKGSGANMDNVVPELNGPSDTPPIVSVIVVEEFITGTHLIGFPVVL